MRKLIMTLGVSLLMVTGVYAQNITLNINDEIVIAPVSPVMEKGVTLVPLRVISENLGATVDWEKTTSTVTITNKEKEIKLVIGKKSATVNGETKKLLAAPKLIKGTTMVPIRVISENLGTAVVWDGPSQTVIVGGNGKPVPKPGRYFAVIPFDEGDLKGIYEGEVVLIGGGEIPDGKGTLAVQGMTMEANFEMGLPVGKIKLKADDGITGDMEIHNMETLDFSANIRLPDGSSGKMIFKNGMLNGQSTISLPDGSSMVIQFKNNKPVGKVKVSIPGMGTMNINSSELPPMDFPSLF